MPKNERKIYRQKETKVHDVGYSDHCFAGHPRGAGLSALGYARWGSRASGSASRSAGRWRTPSASGTTSKPKRHNETAGRRSKREASRLFFYKLCALPGYLSRALWSAPPMVNAARGPVWVQTTAVSSGASGSAASRASTETVVERESRVVNTRVFTP